MKFIITFTTLIKFSTFIQNTISIEHGHFQQGCSQLPGCKALGGSRTLCYSVTKSELNAQAFVCITGFSLFLLWFIVNCFCVACNFQWYHRSDKSVVQHYILIKTKIITMPEYVVVVEPPPRILTWESQSIIWFCSKQSSIFSQVAFNISQL